MIQLLKYLKLKIPYSTNVFIFSRAKFNISILNIQTYYVHLSLTYDLK